MVSSEETLYVLVGPELEGRVIRPGIHDQVLEPYHIDALPCFPIVVVVQDLIEGDDVNRLNRSINRVLAEPTLRLQILKFEALWEYERLGDGSKWYAVWRAECKKRGHSRPAVTLKRTIFSEYERYKAVADSTPTGSGIWREFNNLVHAIIWFMAGANTDFLADDPDLKHFLPHIDKRILYSTPDTEIRKLDRSRVIVVPDSDDEDGVQPGEGTLPCGDQAPATPPLQTASIIDLTQSPSVQGTPTPGPKVGKARARAPPLSASISLGSSSSHVIAAPSSRRPATSSSQTLMASSSQTPTAPSRTPAALSSRIMVALSSCTAAALSSRRPTASSSATAIPLAPSISTPIAVHPRAILPVRAYLPVHGSAASSQRAPAQRARAQLPATSSNLGGLSVAQAFGDFGRWLAPMSAGSSQVGDRVNDQGANIDTPRSASIVRTRTAGAHVPESTPPPPYVPSANPSVAGVPPVVVNYLRSHRMSDQETMVVQTAWIAAATLDAFTTAIVSQLPQLQWDDDRALFLWQLGGRTL